MLGLEKHNELKYWVLTNTAFVCPLMTNVSGVRPSRVSVVTSNNLNAES